jgi:uncharacterized protein YjbI with pentapeptide repeats
MSTETDARTLAERFAAHAGVEAPEGMVLGWRTCHRDLRSRDGYRWPWPGGWAKDTRKGVDLRKATAPHNACPNATLGGVCIAKTFAGAATGSIPVGTILVTAHFPKDVLGEETDKLRVKRALVLDVVDLISAIRGANLRGANLGGADLGGANLGGAYLGGADLGGADLRGADLRGANLGGANLGGADLGGANLRGADLRGADLRGAYASASTIWPLGFVPSEHGAFIR